MGPSPCTYASRSFTNPRNIQAELSLAASATQSETTTLLRDKPDQRCCPAARQPEPRVYGRQNNCQASYVTEMRPAPSTPACDGIAEGNVKDHRSINREGHTEVPSTKCVMEVQGTFNITGAWGHHQKLYQPLTATTLPARVWVPISGRTATSRRPQGSSGLCLLESEFTKASLHTMAARNKIRCTHESTCIGKVRPSATFGQDDDRSKHETTLKGSKPNHSHCCVRPTPSANIRRDSCTPTANHLATNLLAARWRTRDWPRLGRQKLSSAKNSPAQR